MTLQLTAAEVQELIDEGLPAARDSNLVVEEVRAGYARVRLPYHPCMLRPGGVISGPTLFTAADSAMYALVLSHLGPALMAVTANMTLNFLSKAKPGDVIAEAELLKLGRRLAVMQVRLRTGTDSTSVAHATGSYALPG